MINRRAGGGLWERGFTRVSVERYKEKSSVEKYCTVLELEEKKN